MRETESVDDRSRFPSQASPAVASVFTGITAVMWSQAVLRFLGGNLSVEILNLLIPEKMTDVFATWLMSILIGVIAAGAAYLMLRRRKHYGSLKAWVIVMLISVTLRYL